MRQCLLALPFLLASPAAAQVQLLEAGIVCPRTTKGELIEAPDTEVGAIRLIEGGVVFDLNARTVPTMSNLSFGFRIGLKESAPAQDVTIVVTHPPMGDRGVTRQSWGKSLLPGEAGLSIFTFEYDYEKVPGPWTFGVEIEGETAIEVPFQVTEEGGRGPVEAACFRFMS
ncbi:DUF3859 domain-containing protein [Jannaschia seohaensis]|uniref:Uncharacterized protein DUF3859 n=1 Tax=Jannaschia seohaensis TaxID=475081 RepID=A0A2Y9AA10_9RHOB|nr:DUF3859 domain-containing protein [Jannaschia seohaensis]PWJ20974.1 uncharacterized protein DUF3859 [Jannaschia seohaensis]SSA41384.1 protein of unknown function [Jannaschia seohaensis]